MSPFLLFFAPSFIPACVNSSLHFILQPMQAELTFIFLDCGLWIADDSVVALFPR